MPFDPKMNPRMAAVQGMMGSPKPPEMPEPMAGGLVVDAKDFPALQGKAVGDTVSISVEIADVKGTKVTLSPSKNETSEPMESEPPTGAGPGL